MRQRHARFFLEFAIETEPELVGADPSVWLDRLEHERDNFRSALDCMLEAENLNSALRLGFALWRFWEIRGFFAEGLSRLRALAEAAQKADNVRDRLKIYYAAGVMADAAGEYKLARGFFEQNLALNRQLGDLWGIANSLNNLGIVVLRQQDYESALAHYQESLMLWRGLGNLTAVALSLNNLGNVYNVQGDRAKARLLHEEALGIFSEMQDRRGVAWSLNHLGDVARDEGDHQKGLSLYEESLKLFGELGISSGEASALTDLGNLSCDRGDYASARAYYQEAMVILGELGDRRGIARLLDGIMVLAALQRNHERAVRLAGAATRLRETLGVFAAPAEQAKLENILSTIRAALGDEAFRAAWSEGNEMPVEKAIKYALLFEP